MSQSFNFRLESILKLRHRELEAAQQRFALQQDTLRKISNLLDENVAQLDAVLSPVQVEQIEQNILNPLTEAQRFAYVQFLKAQRHQLRSAYHEAQSSLEVLRQELALAHRNKRALEILKAKQKLRFDKRLQTKALQETDDLVVQRFGR